jgi:hypothetical protein
LQENFVDLAVSGLASMYPALLEHGLLAIMDISARAISLAERPQRAIRVTCRFRKFHPTWIGVTGQNRRIMKRDVCDPSCPWNASL